MIERSTEPSLKEPHIHADQLLLNLLILLGQIIHVHQLLIKSAQLLNEEHVDNGQHEHQQQYSPEIAPQLLLPYLPMLHLNLIDHVLTPHLEYHDLFLIIGLVDSDFGLLHLDVLLKLLLLDLGIDLRNLYLLLVLAHLLLLPREVLLLPAL